MNQRTFGDALRLPVLCLSLAMVTACQEGASVFTPSSPEEIGRTLDVGAVLEGSVHRAGNRLRITAELVNVSPFQDSLCRKCY